MNATRAGGYTVPVMNMQPAKPAVPSKRRSREDDIEVEEALLDNLRIDRQTNRAIGKNAKGKFEIPRTVCWDRFYNAPLRHVVQCGHIVQTNSAVACGINCRLVPTAKRSPHGPVINCRRCIERKAISHFIPRKRARRNTMPATMTEMFQMGKSKAVFVAPEKSEDSDEVILAKAGYPGHGGAKKPKVEFEPLLLANPRKRKAVDEPDVDAHDRPNATDLSTINPEDIHCSCHSPRDESMLRCHWCGEFFHPECVGYGKLARHQILMFESGLQKFYCDGCKDDRAELKFQQKEEKKAMKVHRARNVPKDPAASLAEFRRTIRNRQSAKGKRKDGQKGELLRAKPQANSSTRTERATSKGKKNVSQRAMEVDLTPKRRSSAPPPLRRRFSLSRNKFDKEKEDESPPEWMNVDE